MTNREPEKPIRIDPAPETTCHATAPQTETRNDMVNGIFPSAAMRNMLQRVNAIMSVASTRAPRVIPNGESGRYLLMIRAASVTAVAL